MRTYGQACPIAHSLDMIGERWALLVVRELRLGPRRYVDLQAALPGIGPSVLAQRLRELVRVGVLRRRTLPPPSASKVYELTEWGAELEPVFAALRTWGMRSPVVPRRGDVGADTVLLGLRAYFRAGSGLAWSATYRIRLEHDVYHVRVVGGELTEVRRGEHPTDPDAVLDTDHRTLGAVLTHERSLASALDSGALTVTGDLAAVRRLVDAAGTP
ncbi:winged helix-turn-helix transcriptional regulator [Pseudonocardia eucalypti]|uniref:Winged helix-turn-helix transcriptional regulator n=1 Tax=Pseudonocardia eucalypti TaxID=648755 RepID=A0ABP9Q637_9PSEU|nr:DNA-binding HxlR family transcriptional regulator [Pseudonocardia eucalypti]